MRILNKIPCILALVLAIFAGAEDELNYGGGESDVKMTVFRSDRGYLE